MSDNPTTPAPPDDVEARLLEIATRSARVDPGYSWDAARNLAIHDVPWLIAQVRALRAERDAARERERELQQFGGQLSNVAFNLAQRDALEPSVRETLDTCRRLWDATVEKHVRARAAAGGREAQP